MARVGRHKFASSVAVTIGIDDYSSGIPKLRTAVADARSIGSVLSEHHGYRTHVLVDEAATLEALTDLFLRQLPSMLSENDRLLVYFAGHGVALDGDDGPNGYLLPYDAKRGVETSYLHMPLLHDALIQLPCRHLLTVLDSCFSGAFRWSGMRSLRTIPETLFRERFDRYIRAPAWQAISSASHDQEALDQLTTGALGARPGEGDHSPFALALRDGLAGAADIMPAPHGDGIVTATELYLYIEDRLARETGQVGHDQTPRLWPLRKHDKGEYVFAVPGREASLPSAPELTYDNNPYRGLQSFDSRHSTVFFGRDDEIEALTQLVTGKPLTTVVGASGTGKSSLVRAGLIPRLLDDDESEWRVVGPFRPGSDPIANLRRALTDVGVECLGAKERGDLIEAVEIWFSKHPGIQVLVVVDQLEELITHRCPSTVREQFLAILAALPKAAPSRARVLTTVRSDFESAIMKSPTNRLWADGRFAIPPMSLEDLREVIEGPARVAVLYFESDDLIDALVEEVILTPGALPLLSFTLSEMYVSYIDRQSDDRALTWSDYHELGGVVGALRHRAEQEYEAVPAEQEAMRLLMLRMVAVEGGALAKRRVLREDLEYGAEQDTQVDQVIARLVARRLLVEGSDRTGRSYVEPAHDALITGWEQLLIWARAEEARGTSLALQRRLERAAKEWEQAEGAGRIGVLWRDASRADLLSELVGRSSSWMNTREVSFARASVRRRRVLRWRWVGVAGVLAAAGLAATVFGIIAQTRAERIRSDALVRRAGLEPDAHMARHLLVEAGEAADDLDPFLAMSNAHLALRRPVPTAILRGHTGEIRDLQFTADGATLASASFDGTVRLWDTSTWNSAGVLSHGDSVRVVRFDSSGSRVLTITTGGARLWDLDTDPVEGTALGTDRLWDGTFTPSDASVLAVSDNHVMNHWRLDGTLLDSKAPEAEAAPSFPRALSQVTTTEDSRVVTTGLDGTVRVWEPTLETHEVYRGHTDQVTSLAVSPDGRLAVSGAMDGTARLWGLEGVPCPRADQRSCVLPHNRHVLDVSFAPTGVLLATASADSVARLWRSVDGSLLRELRGHRDTVFVSQFSPSSMWLATSSADGTVRLWPTETEGPSLLFERHAGRVRALAFSPDGRWLASGSEDGTLRVWPMPVSPAAVGVQRAGFTSGRQAFRVTTDSVIEVRDLRPSSDWQSLAVLPPGFEVDALHVERQRIRALVSGADGNEVIEHRDGAWTRLDTIGGGFAQASTFSPEGSRALSLGRGELRFWSEETGTASFPVDRIQSFSLSPDGSRLAVGFTDGSFRVTSPGPPWVGFEREFGTGPGAHNRGITTITFADNGNVLVTTSTDGTARMWDATTPGPPQAVADNGSDSDESGYATRLAGHTSDVTGAALGASGRKLTTWSREDESVRIWSIGSESDAPLVATLRAGSGIVPQDAKLVLGGTVLVSAWSDGRVRAWPAEVPVEPLMLELAGAPPRVRIAAEAGADYVLAYSDQGVALWPLHWSTLRAQLADELTTCLLPAERQAALNEPIGQARTRSRACERARMSANEPGAEH